MLRTQHPSNNAVLGAPPGASIEECGALPITRVRFEGGELGIVSFWRPTPAELALLQAGQPVRLCVMGTTHAPLSLGVDGDGVLVLPAPAGTRAL